MTERPVIRRMREKCPSRGRSGGVDSGAQVHYQIQAEIVPRRRPGWF